MSDVPLDIQVQMYRRRAHAAIDQILAILEDPDDVADLIRGGEERLRRNHEKYQSEMYAWFPARRRQETYEELEDAIVYLTGGRI